MDTGQVDSTDLVKPAAVDAVAREPPADGVFGRMDEGQPPAVEEAVPPAPRSIKLLELPTEVLLLILESLLAVGPITLLGAVPGVCRRLRALCAGVHGEFDLRGECGRLDRRSVNGVGEWAGLKGALASAARLFPQTKGLWTFSKFPLHDACEAGLLAAAGRLVEEDGSRVDGAMGQGGWTPLYSACWCGYLEVVRLLAEKGADLDKVDTTGWTALWIACWCGHLDVVQLLVEKGADLDTVAVSGRIPLFVACWIGRLDVAAELVDWGEDLWGADLDTVAVEGRTALCIARDEGHAEIVALLEEAGAAE